MQSPICYRRDREHSNSVPTQYRDSEVTSNIFDERLAKWLSEHSTHKCTEKKATEKTLIYRKEQAEGVNFFPPAYPEKKSWLSWSICLYILRVRA